MDEEAIFVAALEHTSIAERSAFIDEACGGDAALRNRIEALLGSHQHAGTFLNISAGPTLNRPITEQPGTQIGPYKLLEQIGEGGMGVVYMAEQVEPVERRVALKIIKPGMDSQQVIARFEVRAAGAGDDGSSHTLPKCWMPGTTETRSAVLCDGTRQRNPGYRATATSSILPAKERLAAVRLRASVRPSNTRIRRESFIGI